jgi:hypothetical protein
MTTPDRRDLDRETALAALRVVSWKFPELRLCQLIVEGK